MTRIARLRRAYRLRPRRTLAEQWDGSELLRLKHSLYLGCTAWLDVARGLRLRPVRLTRCKGGHSQRVAPSRPIDRDALAGSAYAALAAERRAA